MATSQKKNKCGKRPDANPSRPRYWMRGRLALNKIRRMVRSSGYTPRGAFEVWRASRKRHIDGKKFQLPTLKQIDRIR